VADLSLERAHARRGHRLVAGVDEVGRGALCGPVVAAAVILPADWLKGRRRPKWLSRTDDSKLLTPKQRADLFGRILADARSVGVGRCTAAEIDSLNILRASHEAMRRALASLDVRPDAVLVDGRAEIPGLPLAQTAIIRGDRRSLSIAAASIVAKVLRDAIMQRFDVRAPGYGLARNKGYGTEEHYSALEVLGPTDFHRKSFRLFKQETLF
jgi:ribonuclease HII